MKKALSIVGIIIVAVIGLVIIINRSRTGDDFLVDSIIEPSSETGYIPEKIIGNPDEATLILFEYADYGCSHCADWNKSINELVKEYDGKLAVVFRSYDLNFKNGQTAARAATAAQIQGFWKEYKDLLFNNQAEWLYADKEELVQLLLDYFKTASDGAGDLDQFKDDLNSSSVKQRLKFEQNMGKKVNLRGTPLFRINGESVSPNDLIETIKKRLKA